MSRAWVGHAILLVSMSRIFDIWLNAFDWLTDELEENGKTNRKKEKEVCALLT